MILISALLISVGACLYAFIRHRRTMESMNTMMKELETLQQAEGDLISVTGKYENTRISSKEMISSNRVKAMENELQDKTKVDRGLLNAWFIEVQRAKVNQSIDFYWKILFRNVNVFFSGRSGEIS